MRMFKRVSFGLIVVLALAGSVFVYGLFQVADVLQPSPSYTTRLMPHPDGISAPSWIVFDVTTGEELFAHNADEVLPIASVTKFPAAAVFYQFNDLFATATILWDDVSAEGRAGRLGFGDQYSYHDLLFPLLLESSNDAAAVIERVDPGIIDRMNEYVQEHELTETTFVDASGLSVENVSTARELMYIGRDVYVRTPHIVDITSLPHYLNHINAWQNNNPYITDPAYRGGKHGYTPEAGRTVVAFFDETLREGNIRTLGYVLLKSNNLADDMALLRGFVRENASYK